MRGGEGLRWVDGHPWYGRQVVHPRTGRTGRLGLVIEHLVRDDLGRERVVWSEAHMRPLDGSGREWRADLDDLRRVDEPGPAERGVVGGPG
ncbi:hypothetical protein ACTWP5_18060 [Streptomyces sp. 4N509B]|uniref:hypothetical protein n=1 Tax=Streptomyces sp. 4N509B TaxID=3457413 RepID=UPI003FCEF98C